MIGITCGFLECGAPSWANTDYAPISNIITASAPSITFISLSLMKPNLELYHKTMLLDHHLIGGLEFASEQSNINSSASLPPAV